MADSMDPGASEPTRLDWRLGTQERQFGGMTLLQGCLLLMTVCILIFFWVSFSHLSALDRDAARSQALLAADLLVHDISALRERSAGEDEFVARLQQLQVDAHVVSIRVWREGNGEAIYRRGDLARSDEPALSRQQTASAGSRMDPAQQRVIRWAPIGLRSDVAAVEVDARAFLPTGRAARFLKDEALLGIPPLLFLALFLAIWRLNVNELHRLSEDPAGRGARALPWWASSELILARRVSRHVLEMHQGRLSAKKQMIALMQGLLDEVTEAVIACDVNGCVLVSNLVANELWSPDGHSLVGQPMPPALAAFIESELQLGQGGGWLAHAHPLPRRVLETEVGSARGVLVPMRLSAHVVAVEDATWLVIQGLNRKAEIYADQLAHDAMSKFEQADQAKSRFLATVSHEIRTPLNGLFGMLDLLSRTELVDDQRHLLETARVSGRQLRSLLDDVLDLSKIEAGKLEFESVPFDVQEQLGRALHAFSPAAQVKGLTLSLHWHTPQRMLMGDVYRISQVLNNLIDNALKFTESGYIAVDVRTEQPNPDQSLCNLWVTVEDSGRGIPADRMPHIFQPFTQADQSVTRTFGGSGLGLSLCRELCHGMGGHIAAAARPGGGTIFTSLVRCEIAYGMSPFVETRPSEDSQLMALHGARVLAVDDNRVNQTLLARWLKSAGMTVTQAFDGEAAVTAVIAQPFDIILMDISMPRMNGLDAARAIRALARSNVADAQRFSAVPILGVSAHAMSGDREACLAAGMNGYVTKPIQRDVLFERMVRALLGAPPATLDESLDPDASVDTELTATRLTLTLDA